MKVKKRKKTTRARGSHTQGTGAKKKHRGKGHRGGVGMSGSGKRADHKKTMHLGIMKYFGKSKTLRRGTPPTRLEVINLSEISIKYAGKKTADLTGFKILSSGELIEKIEIKASAASKRALEKAEKSGSKIILFPQETEEAPEKKKEPVSKKSQESKNKD